MAAILAVLVFSFNLASAANENAMVATGFEKICSKELGIGVCIQQIYLLALGLGAIVALLMIILAGYRYMTAKGNASQVENAKEALTSAFIGLIIIFVAFILLYLINPDLVKFRKFGFPPIESPGGVRRQASLDPVEVSEVLARDLNLQNTAVDTDSGILRQVSGNAVLTLTPVADPRAAVILHDRLDSLGFDTSTLTFSQYAVNDPSLLPASMTELMDGQRPSEIVVVEGSLSIFDARAIVNDVSGEALSDAASEVALNHYGLDLGIDAITGGGREETPEAEDESGDGGDEEPPVSSVLSFRYLRVETTENGWVSWREIEIYDPQGEKVRPASARASAVYNGRDFNPNPTPPQVPENVYDGNIHTPWNAGETNPNCNRGVYGPSCPTSSRSAWIELDLGEVKNVSQLRLMQSGNSTSEISKLTVSNDGSNYRNVTEFRAPMRDQEWLQYPAPAYAGEPNLTFRANGKREITVKAGDSVKYTWGAQNADYLQYSVARNRDDSLGKPSSDSSFCQQSIIIESVTPDPFSSFAGIIPASGDKSLSTGDNCSVGMIYTFTLKAYQRYADKFVEEIVVVRVKR